MTDQLALAEAKWIPKARRVVLERTLAECGAEGRSLFAFAFLTKSVPALELWSALQRRLLLKDTGRRLTRAVQEHAVMLAGSRALSPMAVETALGAIVSADAAQVAGARSRFLEEGAGVSLASAHGIYVAAARKAQKASLPSSAPHLGGPTPELTVFETVALAMALARVALQKVPSDEGEQALTQAARQLAWARAGASGPAPVSKRDGIPQPAKDKGPGFALARAALMEACNVDHVSARGTSIKSAVLHGLSLGEPWWLSQLDEALMAADARSAFEKRKQSTSSPLVKLVWRGGDAQSRLWLVKLASGRYALLAKLGRTWATHEGDLDSVAATIPDAWFAAAMKHVESRR